MLISHAHARRHPIACTSLNSQKVFSIVTLSSQYTRLLIFENISQGVRARVSEREKERGKENLERGGGKVGGRGGRWGEGGEDIERGREILLSH